MKKVLKYKSAREESPDSITTLNKVLPTWYKKTLPWKNNKIQLVPKSTQTFKKCVPFLDSMLLGYAITLPADILIDQNAPELISWGCAFEVAGARLDNNNELLPVPEGFLPIEFVWRDPGSFKVPKGYSAIITHPFNRYELPFLTLTGVIDGEFVMAAGGNLPFWLRKDYNGIIPKGTPIAQVIPFKRESWQLEEDESVVKEGYLNMMKTNASILTGWYKNEIWQKKTYE